MDTVYECDRQTDRQTDRRTELRSQRPCNAERRTVTKCQRRLQQLCKSCRTCFKFYCMFYCMFYFTCDRSLSDEPCQWEKSNFDPHSSDIYRLRLGDTSGGPPHTHMPNLVKIRRKGSQGGREVFSFVHNRYMCFSGR